MNKETKKVLTQDTVAETENLLGGKHWSEFGPMEQLFCLGNAMSDNERKMNHLKKIGDTHYGMFWSDFKNMITLYGFVPALEYNFEYSSWYNSIEECIIYYHPIKGMVIHATSFSNKTSVNGGHLYAEIEANSGDDAKTIWKWLSTGGRIKDLVYETQQDVREGLFSKLNELESAGTFLNRWTKKNRFLWFLDYVEDKVPGYDYQAITQSKIERCPKEFRDIIGR